MGGTRDLYDAIRAHGPGGAPATDDELSARASARRRRGRLLGTVLAVWVCALVVVGACGSYVGTYGFLAQGSDPSPMPSDPGSLFVTTRMDASGSAVDVYCWSSGGEFSQLVTIKNTGLLPVTIYGEEPRSGWFGGQEGLALYLDPSPTDPETAPIFESRTLGADKSIEVWARFDANALRPLSTEATSAGSTIWVEYSVLWETRVARIATRPREIQPRCTAP